MRRLNISELCDLEVINLCGGEKLGYPCDFEIDIDDCKVISLTVPVNCGFSLFEKREVYVIPWCKIECIGEDAILIRLNQSELSGCKCSKKSKSKSRYFR